MATSKVPDCTVAEPAAGCTPGSVSGGFLGTDSGATTSAIALTSQDTFAILFGQANSASKTTLTLGLGAVYVG